jgi:hypothetical protein
MALQNASSERGNVLVEGKLLSGPHLLQYAQQKGLCTKCVQHVTHKRVKKRLGMLRSVTPDWIPITIKDDQEGNYTVYKGYCLQPTCWTLSEVQAILGEASAHRAQSAGRRRTSTPGRPRGERRASQATEPGGESRGAEDGMESRSARRDTLGTVRCQSQGRAQEATRHSSHSRPWAEAAEGMPSGDRIMERRVVASSRDLTALNDSDRYEYRSQHEGEGGILPNPEQSRLGERRSVASSRDLLGKRRSSSRRINSGGSIARDAYRRGSPVSTRELSNTDHEYDEVSVGSKYSTSKRSDGVGNAYMDRHSIRSIMDTSRSRLSVSSRELGRASLSSSRSSRHLDNFLDAATAANKSPYVRRSVLDLSGSDRSPASFYSRQSESNSSDEEEDWKQAGNASGKNTNTMNANASNTTPIRSMLNPPGSMRTRVSPVETPIRSMFNPHGSRSSASPVEPILKRPSIAYGAQPSSDASTRNRLVDSRLTSSSFRDLRPTSNMTHDSNHSRDGSNRHHSQKPSRRRFSMTATTSEAPQTLSSLDVPSTSSMAEIWPSLRDLRRHDESKSRLRVTDEMSVMSRFDHIRESSFSERGSSRHLADSRHCVEGEAFTSPSPASPYNRPADVSSSEYEDDTKENVVSIPTSNSKALQRWRSLSHGLSAIELMAKTSKECENFGHFVQDRGLDTTRQPSQRLVTQSPSVDRVVMRRAVPDLDILQHLRHICLEQDPRIMQRSAISASAENLWTSLHTRYGDSALPSISCFSQAATLICLLEQTDNTECVESCWALLSYTTKLEEWVYGDGEGVERKILNRITVEFDHQDVDFTLTKYIGETMCNMIEAESDSLSKNVTGWLQSMPGDLRYQWIAILFNVVFVGANQRQENDGLSEILQVISVLLSFQTRDARLCYSAESQQLFEGLADVAMKILSSGFLGSSHDSNNDMNLCNNGRLLETTLSILASVASLGACSSLGASSIDCAILILDVMQRNTTASILHRGVLATRHVFDSNVESIDASTCVHFADKVGEIAMMTLMFEKQNPSLQLALEACLLVTLLLQKQFPVKGVVEDSLVLQQPIVVETIVQIVDTSDDTSIVDEGLRMLFLLATKHPTSCRHLRQTRNIASKLVDWLVKCKDSTSSRDFICLIIEYLVSSEDHMLGQELGQAGGLSVLSSLVQASAKEVTAFEAASRALVGVIAVVEMGLLLDCSALVASDVAEAMSTYAFSLELQMAGLNVLHCLCLRSDADVGQGMIIVPVAVKSMENHFGSVDLLTRCCTIIRMIASKPPVDQWSVIIETGGVKLIINAMLVHPVSTELVLEGMATIKDLAAKESFRDHFSQEDAELAVVSALPLHSRNPEVLSLAFATLNNIAVDARSHSVAQMNVDVFHFLLSALTEFPNDYRVTRNACLLLKSYTYDEGNLDMMRTYHNAVVPSLHTMSQSSNNEIRERAQYIMNKM